MCICKQILLVAFSPKDNTYLACKLVELQKFLIFLYTLYIFICHSHLVLSLFLACIGGGIQPCRRVARIARRAMHTWTVAGIASWGVPTLADIALDGRRELSLKLFFIY